MSHNEKALSDKRKATRVNSEPDALSTLRTKDSATLTAPAQDEAHSSGIITRIKGLRSEIYKRVSRVMSDEDMQMFRSQSRLSNVLSPEQPADVADNPEQEDEEEEDPNIRGRVAAAAAELSLHDVYRELQMRRSTTTQIPTAEGISAGTSKQRFSDQPKVKVMAEKVKKTEEDDCEVRRVLQELKSGKDYTDIQSSRSIVQKEVLLSVDPEFPLQRDEQGGQFGLRIVGGKKTMGGTLCAFIAYIAPGSPAARSELEEGDLVVRWNDYTLIDLTYEECHAHLDKSQTVQLTVSNYLRGSYRRYRPRSANSSRSGSVESILRGTTDKWIAKTRRGVLKQKQEASEMIQEELEIPRPMVSSPGQSAKIKLEMRLIFVAMENRLSVHLIQAANIPFREGVDGLDLFCKLYLLPDQAGEFKRRSKTALRTYNPYWNQHFEYQPVNESTLSDCKLEVSLLAHHWLQKHELLGQTEIAFRGRQALSGQANWYYLQAPSIVDQTPRSSFCLIPAEQQDQESPAGAGHLSAKSLSDMMKDKVTIQHRITFSTFDAKKSVPDIRRSASDTTKPLKPPKPKLQSDEDSSDNVFTAQVIQTHLSNIKESEQERLPIQARSSPRRRPKVIRNKSTTRETPPKPESAAVCRRAYHSDDFSTITAQPSHGGWEANTLDPAPKSSVVKYRRYTSRSNSEDLSATKHRVLPKTPDEARSEATVHTLPSKKMVSPLLAARPFATTRVILTVPSSEECGNSSSSPETIPAAAVPHEPSSLSRPSPEGGKFQNSLPVDTQTQLGPGQISVPEYLRLTTPGTLVLTLGIDQNMLSIEIVQANGLPARSSTGFAPDTYVKTYILLEQHKSHKEKTTVVKNSANPVFNETITYILNPTNKILQVMVWDEVGALRRNNFLGEVLIDLNYIALQGPLQGRYKLCPSYSPNPP